jgi:hypothetical protein
LDFIDSRTCNVIRTTIFDWIDAEDRYVAPDDVATEYANTGMCALREGHEAFRAGDYLWAIDAYTRAVDLLTTDEQVEPRQYAQIRLALAYALNGDADKADTRLQALHNVTPFSDVMERYFQAAENYPISHNPFQFCLAMREAFSDPYWDDDVEGPSDIWFFGNLDDVGRPPTYAGNDYGRDATGCDLPTFLETRINSLALTTTASPIAAIQEQIGTISAMREIDINRDGVSDWLIWFGEFANQGFLVWSADNDYRAIHGNVLAPDENESVFVHEINGDTLLVTADFGQPDEFDHCPDTDLSGGVRIDRWNSNRA